MGQSLYDVLPSEKYVFNLSVPPLSPPLKYGSTIPVHTSSIVPSNIAHKAIDTNATETTTGVPISEKYKIIPALKQYQGRQRYPCFNCKSDVSFRHYYLQCTQLCQFSKCLNSNSPPHWGNLFINFSTFFF